jgi:hypothetical protein
MEKTAGVKSSANGHVKLKESGKTADYLELQGRLLLVTKRRGSPGSRA